LNFRYNWRKDFFLFEYWLWPYGKLRNLICRTSEHCFLQVQETSILIKTQKQIFVAINCSLLRTIYCCVVTIIRIITFNFILLLCQSFISLKPLILISPTV